MSHTKKLAALAILPVLGAGAIGAQMAFAQSDASTTTSAAVSQIVTQMPADFADHANQMFQDQANLLGATLDEVKQAWAQGESLQDLATAKGITAADLRTKMQAQRLEQEKSELSAMVSSGVITQAQADTRLTAIQNGTVKGGFQGGPGHGGPGGPGF